MVRKSLLLLSVLSGLLLSLPWMSASFSCVLFVAFVPLLFVEDQIVRQKQSTQAVFFYSLITFLVWNVLSIWWISYVSFVGMMFIACANATLMACVWCPMHFIRRKWNARTGYFSLVVFWLTFEFFHFHWSFQWPWMTLGNGFANSVQLIQWYEYTGVLGGSLWILLTNILLFSVYRSFSERMNSKFFQLSACVLLLIALPASWSFYRYYTYSEKGKAVEVVVLQPNINPYSEKFSGMSIEEQNQRLISLAKTAVSDSPDFILAPETALPTMWEDSALIQNQPLKSKYTNIRKYSDASFIAGAITQRRFNQGEPISKTARQSDDGDSYYDTFNSALMIDSTSGVQIGHKSILVSGVEKIPFQEYFSFLGKYVVHIGGVGGNFASASESTVFEGANDCKVGSVICFESAFGEFVGSTVKKGASLIFVITNDGWWKNSSGVRQHFSFSRLRAVETRRSIARSANTGISGFINGRGDVVEKTAVNSCDAISAKIRLNDTITFYVRYGDYLGRASMILSGLMLISFLLVYLQTKR